MSKPFAELSEDEAKRLAGQIAFEGGSDEQAIRDGLTKAGFDGNAAQISWDHGRSFSKALVWVLGPHGESIYATNE